MLKKLITLKLLVASILLTACASKPQPEPSEPAPVIPSTSNNPYYEPRWGGAMEVMRF